MNTISSDTQSSLIYDPFDPHIHRVYPTETYTWLRDEQPVYHNETRDFWALSRFDDVQGALRDWKTYSNAGPTGVHVGSRRVDLYGVTNFLESDPPRHTALRNVVRSAFALREVAQLKDDIKAMAHELLRPLQAAGGGDLATEYCWPLSFNVVAKLLGIPAEDHDQLNDLLMSFLASSSDAHEMPVQPVGSVVATGRMLNEYARELIDKRADRIPSGILRDVLTARDRGLIDDNQAVGIPLLFFEAAIQTPATFMANSLLLLAQNPDQRELIRNQQADIPAAVEELLRYESPNQCLARMTTMPVHLHDAEIPLGATVVVIYGAANRDDRRWPDPDKLDVTREQKRHLAFGEGIHHCIGAPIARLEAQVTLELLLDEIPDYDVAGPVAYVMSYPDWGVQSLPISW